MGKQVNSPFKFLDAYTLEDQNVFFGREKEVDTLYEYTNMNKLVLVYGESGTGKTSLVQCGLASRFDITDWYPMFIRRQGNILDSFEQELRKAAKSSYRDDWVETLRRMNARYLRPTYLVFDQFEELLILGDDEKEIQPFIEKLTGILDADDLGCHILLILREEYIARLYQFEKKIPTLFDRRLRVEPMTLKKVSEVILRSCEQFNIRFQDPQTNVQQIIDGLSSGRSGIALPYLQVYLDMLYREDYARTYPAEPPAESLPELEFTGAEIAAFGEIEDILERFLQEQIDELQTEISMQFPDASDDLVRQVLDGFVTDEGTKRVVPFRIENDAVMLGPEAPDYLWSLQPQLLKLALQGLEARRILRPDEKVYELAHDSLAHLIDKNRSDEQRQFNEIKNRIKNGYAEHMRSGVYFTERQLLSIEEYVPKLKLPDTQQTFLTESRAHVEQLKLKQRREQEEKLLLTQQKLETEQKARKRQQVFTGIITVIALVSVALGLLAFRESQKAKKARNEQAATFVQKEISTAETFKSRGNYPAAIEKLDSTYQFTEDPQVIERLSQLKKNWQDFSALVTEGDDFYESGALKQAGQSYQKALEIESDSLVSRKLDDALQDLEDRFQDLRRRSIDLAQLRLCDDAKELMEEALALKEDESLREEIANRCE